MSGCWNYGTSWPFDTFDFLSAGGAQDDGAWSLLLGGDSDVIGRLGVRVVCCGRVGGCRLNRKLRLAGHRLPLIRLCSGQAFILPCNGRWRPARRLYCASVCVGGLRAVLLNRGAQLHSGSVSASASGRHFVMASLEKFHRPAVRFAIYVDD